MLTQTSSGGDSMESCQCGAAQLLFSWSPYFHHMDRQGQVSKVISQTSLRRGSLQSRRLVHHRTMSEPPSGLGTISRARTMCPSSKQSRPATKAASLQNWRGAGSRLSKANALFAPRPHRPHQTDVAPANARRVVRGDPMSPMGSTLRALATLQGLVSCYCRSGRAVCLRQGRCAVVATRRWI
jgi:hypothetical protein